LDWLRDHPVIGVPLALAVFFLSGYFDFKVLESRGLACATWFTGLLAVCVYVGHPWTTLRLIMSGIMLVTGFILLVRFYERGKKTRGGFDRR